MKVLVLFLIAIFAVVSARKGFGPGEQEWGYSEVRKGAHMFWWLYYATQPGDPTNRPLVIWLQGGPGGSSTGFGNFLEIGPLDAELSPRNSTWVKDCNLMFIDNPVGTGYSYVDDNSLLTTNNKEIALDLLHMIKDFYKQFPKFQETALYITGESYGGKMIVELALELDAAIKRGEIQANFKGIGLGDSAISTIDNVMNYGPYLLQFGLVDQEGHDKIMESAKLVQNASAEGMWSQVTDNYYRTMEILRNVTYNVDSDNVLTTITNTRLKNSIFLPGTQRAPSLLEIMNKMVRAALGDIPDHVQWVTVNETVYYALWEDMLKPVTHIVEQILDTTNLKVAVYSGQLDLILNTPGTVKWVQNMNWTSKDEWLNAKRVPLLFENTIQGFVRKYGNLGLYWVNRAGHMVAADNPKAMNSILKQLTNNFSGK